MLRLFLGRILLFMAGSSSVNTAVVKAVARRDLRMYFSSPSGYVFITLFIFMSAAAAFWQDRFFLQNLANLDQLNGVFPFLLVFFIPALTMGVWSEEKKLGTDELLLTLPASDVEVVLGKYLAVLGIYTSSLGLSLSYVLVLFYLGSPDLGLMFGNYTGYWLAGAALIAVGMLASLLTRNATVAFILAGLFCALLVATGGAVGSVFPSFERSAMALGVFLHFDDFAKGIVSLSGVIYFVAIGSFFLYLNVLVLSRRHWPARADGYPMWTHQVVRGTAIVIALISFGVLVTRFSVRVDVTAEQLHSLSDETRALLAELPEDRPVFIQAYVSPVVPEPFVQTRSNLISILEEIDAIGGSRVEVLIHDTEAFTDAAREARETFGIGPRPVRNVSTARSEVEQVYLGVAFTCGAEEQVVGFFDVGLPAEYEIMRSIRVVARAERKRIGVVATMANLFGGTNFQQSEFTPQWSVVAELRKQYDVVEISPEMAISQEVDALLVPLPSSLQTDEQGFVADYIRSGTPALILVDPLPAVNPTLSPTEWVGDGNPFTYPPGQPRPGPRGNVREWIGRLGVDWEPTRIVWDSYNPHPELAHMPEDVVFLGAGNENDATFSSADSMTSQLQELVLLYPGQLGPTDDTRYAFEPLLRSGTVSGTNGYFSLVRGSPFGPQVNPSPPRRQDDDDYILAARVRFVEADTAVVPQSTDSNREDDGDEETEDSAPADDLSAEPAGEVDIIVVADLDFVSEQFFAIRQQAPGGLNFDNITFFLNAMDTLLEEDSFIDLRSRRARHRTLERVEAQTAEYIQQRATEERQAEEDAEQALTDAQRRLNDRVAELQSRTDIDAQTKQIMVQNLEEVENRRLSVLSTNINSEKDTRIQASRESMESQVRQIQTSIKTFAILLPPIPVIVLGAVIFARRQRREREGAAAARRLKE
ncbi:MAG: Gldg family protein [Acidobacteriota bacterium]|nr:Gldg family protein [Acidobacteriota bacterium]